MSEHIPETRVDIGELRRQLSEQKGPELWRSLEELSDSEEFQEYLHKEFPRQAAPLESAVDRRGFLKFLGASLALAGLTACARPLSAAEKVVPYVRQPEQIVPGRPLFYASAISSSGYAEGVLVESHQGRPTKLEGNPDHPASLGATTAVTQAAILSLYDPDRSQQVLQNGNTSDWNSFAAAAQASLEASGDGTGVVIVTEPVTSPSLAAQLNAFLEAWPEARWLQYDSTGMRRIYEGTELAWGEALMPSFNLESADVIVSFGADFISDWPGRLRYANHLSARRRIRNADDAMSRLYVFEPTPTPLGSIADHRVPVGDADLVALITAVAVSLGVSVDGATAEAPASVDAALVSAMVADLSATPGRSLVVGSQYLPAEAQALVHAINDVLGNTGFTVSYLSPPEAVAPVGDPLPELVQDIEAGNVSALFLLGVNPVHTAPAALNFASAISSVAFTAHLGQYADETAQASSWHVPQAHFLETWTDARAFDGTATIAQPLIQPFYGGQTEGQLIAALQGDTEATAYSLVSNYWAGRVSGEYSSFWRNSLYAGTVAATASQVVTPSLQALSAPELSANASGYSVNFRPDPSIEDGRWANNGWLQEVPKPFSKLVWDNAALVAARDAEALGVSHGDIISLSVDGRTLELPVWIMPGQAAGTITANLGFGRTAAGRIGNDIGVNANELRGTDGFSLGGVNVTVTGGHYMLVSTQMHHSLALDGGDLTEGTGAARHIVRRGTLEEFQAEPEHPTFVHPVPHHESDLYKDWEYNSYKWGMVIDQNVCTSCNACVVACQSENNIPIVGKREVAIGREMHWLRIDNYYSGTIDNPEFHGQPMLCQHCEKAPCEPVCPVGATVHDHEGLNVMVYNRCVGTRYCSNNCPFKVRRFNYLQYAELSNTATELSMANNPDVTVRSRGVMEKCTYCTQRINSARVTASNEGRTIQDGEVVTACQAACPTNAIVFGDLNDPGSRISQERQSPLNYTLLEELNLFPRNTYVAKVRNINPETGIS